MEAEGEPNEQDEKDDGDLEEGEDDVFEDDDVDPDSVEESHVEEQVDPGKSDGDSSNLPLEAGWFPEEVVTCQEECQAVDEEVKEEDKWQLWFLHIFYLLETFLSLSQDRTDLTISKEENHPGKVESEQNIAKDRVPLFWPSFL